MKIGEYVKVRVPKPKKSKCFCGSICSNCSTNSWLRRYDNRIGRIIKESGPLLNIDFTIDTPKYALERADAFLLSTIPVISRSWVRPLTEKESAKILTKILLCSQ